jgi:hypothetical protein
MDSFALTVHKSQSWFLTPTMLRTSAVSTRPDDAKTSRDRSVTSLGRLPTRIHSVPFLCVEHFFGGVPTRERIQETGLEAGDAVD